MNHAYNIVVTGVGGQGLITLSRIIAAAALSRGHGALVAETHGLSQRGGTVVVHVRLGEAEAPLIPRGAADLLLAMELIEAARHAGYLHPAGEAAVNDYLVPPPLPRVETPPRERLLEALHSHAKHLALVPATDEALRLGDPRTANMILLGAAIEATRLGKLITLEDAEQAINKLFPRAAEANRKALHLGARLARTQPPPPA